MKKEYFIVNNGLKGESITNYKQLKIDLMDDVKNNYYDKGDYFYIAYFNNNDLIIKDFYIISFNQVKKLKVNQDIINFCKNDLRY